MSVNIFKIYLLNIFTIIIYISYLNGIEVEPYFWMSSISNNEIIQTEMDVITDLIKKWAPVVWLAPGEQFFPSSVPAFLKHVEIEYKLPENNFLRSYASENIEFLTTIEDVENLLHNKESFLFGINPHNNTEIAPIYVVLHQCYKGLTRTARQHKNLDDKLQFHITYWMFYPYNKGKMVCVIKPKLFGLIPIPLVFNKCFGQLEEFGSHVGDWEHVSLYFNGNLYPHLLYISVHNAGAYYEFDSQSHRFHFVSQETRKGFFQKPEFPYYISMYDTHPILFSANGSHGLWPTPGRHRYTRISRLYDHTGFGSLWKTWLNIELINTAKLEYDWVQFKGRWGNSKSSCHPLVQFGLDVCKYFDGPTGLILQKTHFIC